MIRIKEFFEKNELLIFVIITLLGSAHVFIYSFYHTLDGPHHLYNSNLITKIIQGNELILSYFKLNTNPIGNWTGHALLAFYNLLLPGSLALSFFVFTYFAGMAFSYRYFIKSINKRFAPIHYIIFPFIDNFSIHLGLFNFSISLVVLLFSMGYWYRINNTMKIGQLVGFSMLLVLLFFSHLLSYLFMGMFLFLFIIYQELYLIVQHKRFELKNRIISLTRLVIAALPSIIIALIYVFSVSSFIKVSNTEPDNLSIWQNLYYVRPLIVFHVTNDGHRNMILFYGIAIIFILVILQSIFYRKQIKENAFIRNFMLLFTFVFAVLFFTIPPHFLLHTMRLRLSLMFFIFFITWISLFKFPKWFHVILALFFISFYVHQKVSLGSYMSHLDRKSKEVSAFNNYIKPNSLVLPVNLTDEWMNIFILSYIGIDKPIVNVRNPQAYGPFPVVWNKEKIPYTLLGEKTAKSVEMWFTSGNNKKITKNIDYVLIYNTKKLEEEKDRYLKFLQALTEYYVKEVESKNGDIVLYKRKDIIK